MGLRRRMTILVVAVLAAVTAGTAGPTPSLAQQPSPTLLPSSPGIEGPVWRLVEYREGEALTPVLPGLTADAIFWAGIVSGSGGCTDFDSTYTLADSTIVIPPPGVVEVDCDPEAQRLQDAYLAGLGQVAGLAIDGAELTLLDAAGEDLLRFTWAQVPADPTIASWLLARLADDSGRLQPTLASARATAEFLPGGRVVGSTGCGSYLGSYRLAGTDLAISGIAARATDCPADEAAQAEAVLAALGRADRFEVTPAGLSLFDASAARMVTWVPSPPPAGALWTPTEVYDEAGEVVAGPAQLETSVLAFGEGMASGRTNCRPWQAAYRRSGLALSVDPVTVPKGPCKPADVQRSFIAALGAAASFAMRGERMELLDARGRPVMRLTPQPPLTDVTWKLTGIDSAPAGSPARLRPPVEGTQPTAAFGAADGLVSGSTGCNDYAADYVTSGIAIHISGALPAGRSCKAPVRRQEGLFLQRLTEADAYVVLRKGLQLLAGDRVILAFEAAEG